MARPPSANGPLRSTWRATIYNAFIGMLITPVMLFGAGAITAIPSAIIGTHPFDLIAAGVLFVALIALLCWLTFASLRDACTHAPCWPIGVAIGYSAGSAVLAVVFRFFDPDWFAFTLLLGYGLSQGVSAYRGVVAGNRAAMLGAKREGTGLTCAHCGYDLSATAEGQVCPECGGVMRYERSVPVNAKS